MIEPVISDYTTLEDSVSEWAAIRTAARWEKKLAETLCASQIPTFLPTLTRVSRYATRKNVVELPLFAGYVFFDHSRIADLPRRPDQQKYIAQIIRTADPLTLKTELTTISEFMKNNQLVQERVFGKVGEEVRIKSGSFRGFEGAILRHSPNQGRLVLAISYLGLSLEVTVDEAMVERQQ